MLHFCAMSLNCRLTRISDFRPNYLFRNLVVNTFRDKLCFPNTFWRAVIAVSCQRMHLLILWVLHNPTAIFAEFSEYYGIHQNVKYTVCNQIQHHCDCEYDDEMFGQLTQATLYIFNSRGASFTLYPQWLYTQNKTQCLTYSKERTFGNWSTGSCQVRSCILPPHFPSEI